jgi:hypothetical protein
LIVFASARWASGQTAYIIKKNETIGLTARIITGWLRVVNTT